MTRSVAIARPSRSACFEFALTLVPILCVGCCALAWTAQLWRQPIRLPSGYVVNACAGVNTTGRFQVRAEWAAPYIESRLPLSVVWSQTVCGVIPWAPFLPEQGGLVFPR
ncbi:MAG: hypothetical protein HY023_08055 [Chloroflexi bacterium]|nr:hypothetical protein [Chloroflexota bacterium]